MRVCRLYTRALAPLLLAAAVCLSAEEREHHNMFGLGVDCGAGAAMPGDINSVLNARSQTPAELVDLTSDIINLQIQYDVAGYALFAPLRLLECTPWFSMSRSVLLSSLVPEVTEGLTLSMQTWRPGISARLRAGHFVVGGGLFRCYAAVIWQDTLFSYSDTWRGQENGFELHAGVVPGPESHFGVTFLGVYENIRIGELRNQAGRRVYFMPENRPFTLDLTGVKLRLGVRISW